MGYIRALEAAGAEVLEHASFGSYQGDLWVRVRHGGQHGWINIAYGSCSGCDSYENWLGKRPGRGWDSKPSHEELAAFGSTYLTDILTQAEAEARAAENASWDSEAPAMLAFIRANPV